MRLKILYILIILFSLAIANIADAQTMSDYSASPTFSSTTVKPNVLIDMDFSGSMQFPAYLPCNYSYPIYDGYVANCRSASSGYNYVSTNDYYGYFDKTKYYKYQASRFQINTACIDTDKIGSSSICISGNLLNWITSTRIDAARKVLTGGRSNAGKLESEGSKYDYTDSNLKCKFTITAGTTTNRQLTVADSGGICPIGTLSTATINLDDPGATGIVQEFSDKVSFEFMVYSSGSGAYSRYGEMRSDKDGTQSSLLSAINNELPYYGTPTGEALWEAYDYFKQSNDNSYEANTSSINPGNGNKDPWYDGPGGSSTAIPCRKAFVLLISDGAYSSGFLDPTTPARTMIINDLRTAAALTGTQNVRTYAVYAFGETTPDGRQSMITTAIFGGFDDYDSNTWPYAFTAYPSSSKTVTYPRTECNYPTRWDSECKEWDKDKDNLPDNFFEASAGDELATALRNALSDMLRRVSSGTSISVLTTSATGAGNIFQCYYLPTKTVNGNDITWLGYLLQLGVNEKGELLDTANNKITFSFNATEGQTYVNVTGGSSYLLTEWTGYEWDAGDKLVTKTPLSRTVKTFIDVDNDGVVDSGEYKDFVDTNNASLRPYLRASTDTESTDIINFIRGASISGYRDRTYSGINQYKLGDIVYSTPTVVSSPAENYSLLYGDKTYQAFFDSNKSRSTTVFIGANDGMLHAFDSTSGNELWSFIPQNLLPHLKWLTDPNYTHVYYVDLRAKVTDINFGDSTNPNWKTVLIGGMRLGGGQISVTDNFGSGSETRNFQSSYFAIDITIPSSPTLLWEFTLSDASLGFTSSYPAVAKVGSKWFVIVGSGPKSLYAPDYTGASTQSGKIFILDARNTGTWTLNSTYWIKDTGVINGFMGDPLAVDIDFKNINTVSGDTITTSYNSEVVYIGMNYGTSPNWKGKLFRLVLNGDVNPANWNLYTLFDGNAFTTATPITISPVATKDELDNLWVYFGTGRFYSSNDKTTTTAHTFIGIRDSYWDGSQWKPCWDGTSWSTNTQCTTSSITATSSLYNSGDVTSVTEGGSSGTVVNSATYGSNVPWNDFVQAVSTNSTYRGWYANLSAGSGDTGAERVITKPTVIGGNVLFTTFIPNSDVCSYGGTSSLYSLYYKTGTAYKESTLETPTEAELQAGHTVAKSKSLGYGMASSPAVHIGQQEGGKATVFIQDSTGRINTIEYQLSLPKSGVISWKEL